MKPALIGVFGRGAYNAGGFTLKTAPAIQDIATQPVTDEQAKKHHRGVNVDRRNAKGKQHNDHKGHTLLHADIFKTVKYGTSNGMPEHSSKLNPIQLQQVSSFVLTLDEAKGKAPEGTIIEN